MNMTRHFITLCTLLLFAQGVNSQCIPEKVFFIVGIGTFEEQISLPMNFHLVGDSVHGYAGHSYRVDAKPIFQIVLVGEPVCNWNDSFTIGETSYKAFVVNEPKPAIPATFKIVYKKSGEKFLVIDYPDQEPRVLKIGDPSDINSH